MYNFLIVDDEVLIRKGTLKKIEKLNLPIQCIAEASNGQEAIHLMKSHSIDFVITDMDMPKIDGVGLLDYLKKDHPATPIIVISGYENFDYVKKALEANAVNYILKPFSREDILKSLNEVIAKLDSTTDFKIREEEMIVNTVLGHKTPSAMKVLATKINTKKDYRLLVMSSFKEVPSSFDSLTSLPIFLSPVPFSEKQLYLAIGEKEQIGFLLEEVESYCFCGLSQKVTDLTDIHLYYQQCIGALNSRNISSEHFKEYNSEPTQDAYLSFEKRAELLYLIEAGKTTEFEEKLSDYFYYLIETKHISLYTLKKLGLSLIEKSKQLLDDFYHTESNYTFPKISKEIMEQTFIFSEVVSYFIEFLSSISAAMSYENLYTSEDIIKNVQTYLEKHYKEPISLNLLADIFYINSSYLSALFKEKTGIKYIDYLNQLRIEEAKTLLCKTNRKAGSIARIVGYENEKYFFRVFKKYTNTTPEQYRTIHKEN